MATHTPGPWLIVDDDFDGMCIHSGCERDVAAKPLVYILAQNIGGKVHGKGRDDYSEVEANARLIAAAPELLEALQEAREQIVLLATCDEIPEAWSITKLMDAAIRKATEGD